MPRVERGIAEDSERVSLTVKRDRKADRKGKGPGQGDQVRLAVGVVNKKFNAAQSAHYRQGKRMGFSRAGRREKAERGTG